MDGVFLINKPKNWTSFDICAYLRKKTNTKKVGHCGTLDPFAEGLLIVTMGKATKIIPYLENEDKEYLATLKLGIKTDTLDITGKILQEKEVEKLDVEQIKRVLSSFLGHSKQTPPMYSALKKDGLPLYVLARDGIEVERQQRDITISNMRLISYMNDEITFACEVSKGTYIRVLGEDIASKLNTIGCLSSLKRTRIGHYYLKDAKKINDIEIEDMISLNDFITFIKKINVDEKTEIDIRNGKKLSLNEDENLVLLINQNQIPLAIYERRNDGYFYSKRGLF